MKVGIKWKGEELKYVNVDDLTLESGFSVKYVKDLQTVIDGIIASIPS